MKILSNDIAVVEGDCYSSRAIEEKVKEDVKLLNRDVGAIAKHSLEAAKPQYQAYFERLNTLWAEGWYT